MCKSIKLTEYLSRLITAYDDHPAISHQAMMSLMDACSKQKMFEEQQEARGYDPATGIKLDPQTGKPIAAPRGGSTAIDILAELDQL